MKVWVLLIFFITEKGPTNIHEVGEFDSLRECLTAMPPLPGEVADKNKKYDITSKTYCVEVNKRK